MRTVQVAMCQILVLDGDCAGNFVRIENAIAEAKDAGADIICFPETVILGWVNSDAHKRACPIPGRNSERLCRLAEKYKAYLCVGLAEKDGENLYDSALLIDDTGRILFKHRKMNIMAELMDPPYTPGDALNVVETKYGKIGMLICADTFDDKIVERMAELKPDVVLIPYGWAAQENQWPDHGKSLARLAKKVAKKTAAAVVATDLIGQISKGPWKGRTYGGHSVTADKNGKIIAIAKDRDRDIKIVSINTAP